MFDPQPQRVESGLFEYEGSVLGVQSFPYRVHLLEVPPTARIGSRLREPFPPLEQLVFLYCNTLLYFPTFKAKCRQQLFSSQVYWMLLVVRVKRLSVILDRQLC